VLLFARAEDPYYGVPDSLIKLLILGENRPKINRKIGGKRQQHSRLEPVLKRVNSRK
jgi:hypothetical protein